jgi:nitrilase
MYAHNISIYCAPTADDMETWVLSMRHIAQEGRCFVLSACQFSRRSEFSSDYGWFPSDDPQFIVSRGGSCIVDPFGSLLCGSVYDEAVILTATLDLDLVTRSRHSFDAVGHYSRPDSFELSVDRRKKSPVTFSN